MNNEEKILEILTQMQEDQKQIREEQQQLRAGMSQMRNEQKQMRADMSQMRDEQKQMRADMSQMQATLTRVAVTQENVVIPQIKLLSEGHDMLLQKLARKERVEALEDDVALLKSVVKAMSQRITELEKAGSETA